VYFSFDILLTFSIMIVYIECDLEENSLILVYAIFLFWLPVHKRLIYQIVYFKASSVLSILHSVIPDTFTFPTKSS
jgi:hypothetical protein